MRTNSFAVYQLAVYGQKCKMLNHFSFLLLIYLSIYLFLLFYFFFIFIFYLFIYLFIFFFCNVRFEFQNGNKAANCETIYLAVYGQNCKVRNQLFFSVRTEIRNSKPIILQYTDRHKMRNQLRRNIRTHYENMPIQIY